MTQPLLLLGERGVLAGLGCDRLDLAQAEAQQVGLTGPFPGGRHHLRELPFRLEQLGVEAAVIGQQRRDRLATEGVERLALRAGLQEPVLVGLTVDGDQRLGHTGQLGDRDRGPAHECTGPAFGRHVAGQQHAAALHLTAGCVHGRRHLGQGVHPKRPLDAGGATAGPDGPAVRATSEQQTRGR